jgi:hypothetical protein
MWCVYLGFPEVSLQKLIQPQHKAPGEAQVGVAIVFVFWVLESEIHILSKSCCCCIIFITSSRASALCFALFLADAFPLFRCECRSRL